MNSEFAKSTNNKLQNLDAVNSSISNGVKFLHEHQFANGEFCAYLSGDDAMSEWNLPDSTIFPTILIGSSLLFLKDQPLVEEILFKIENFLKYQMGRYGTWNHFTNLHRLRFLCPQDIDDTACATAFLKQRNVEYPQSLNKSIISHNRRKDGLFYTWFAFRFRFNFSRAYWRLILPGILQPGKQLFFWHKMECGRYDVDTVVNANVLYCLGEGNITEPIINHLIETILKQKEGDCDRWYRNLFSVYYFISRNYHAGIERLSCIRQPIIDRILEQSKPDGRLGQTVLDTALALCSLLNFNYESPSIEKAILFLIHSQKESGEWERWRMYYGGPKKITGYGSEELTTAFCLEALTRYIK